MFTFNKSLIKTGVLITFLFSGVAFADESQLADLFGENFVQKTKQKKITNAKVFNEAIKKDKLKTSSKPLLQKKSNTTLIKQTKKTHYGIGYEYRKILQEQAAHPEKVQRPECFDRMIRPEKIERIERPERIDHPDRPERIDRPERHGR